MDKNYVYLVLANGLLANTNDGNDEAAVYADSVQAELRAAQLRDKYRAAGVSVRVIATTVK